MAQLQRWFRIGFAIVVIIIVIAIAINPAPFQSAIVRAGGNIFSFVVTLAWTLLPIGLGILAIRYIARGFRW